MGAEKFMVTDIRDRYGVNVFLIRREKSNGIEETVAPELGYTIEKGHILFMSGNESAVKKFIGDFGETVSI